MKKALILSGGWDGHVPEKTSALLADLLREGGVSVEIETALDPLADAARLASLDLVVPNWTMGQLSPEQEKGLVAAVENGLGLGGIHGGMGDAFRASTGYQFLVGGQFVAHPDNHKDYVVNLVQQAGKADPIVAGLADFAVHSEQYSLHVDPAVTVLATTTFETAGAPWVNGTVMPVVWTKTYGKGRVFYQALGHGTVEFGIPAVREITKRGLLWALRQAA